MKKLAWMMLAAAGFALTGCPLGAKYTVGGTLTGLRQGGSLVLQDNSGRQLTLDANAAFTLSDSLENKASYSVVVVTQPSNPAQTCSVRNGSGTIGKADVTNVIVHCVAAGRFAYVANQLSNTVSAFVIDSAGALSAMAGSPFVTSEAAPFALTVDPNGLFLYVVNNGSNDVSTFALDATTGAPVSAGFPAPTGTGPVALAIDPTDRFLYVANLSSNSVSAFSIDQATGLTLDANAAFTLSDSLENKASYSVVVVTQPSNPAQTCSVRNGSGTIGKADVTNVIVHCVAAGRFAYVANQLSNTVSAFVIDSAGALSAMAGSPFVTSEAAPFALTVDPNGLFLYVVNNGSNDVSTFALDATTGAPVSAGFPAPTGTGPVALAIDPTDRFLYVANLSSNSVSAFSIDQATGLLTAVAGSPYALGLGPSSIAVDPNGNFLYVANFDGGDVSVLVIDPISGALSPVSGSPFGAGSGPDSIVVDATGSFIYVTNQSSKTISEYTVNASSGALTEVSGSPLGVGVAPESLGADPAGRYLYAANAAANNEVATYSITPAGGALSFASSVAAGLLPDSVAVDPAGGFVYIANDNSADISVYSVDSASGALTQVGGSPFASGNGPRSIAVD